MVVTLKISGLNLGLHWGFFLSEKFQNHVIYLLLFATSVRYIFLKYFCIHVQLRTFSETVKPESSVLWYISAAMK